MAYRRGLEMAVSTLILLVIAVLLLIALAFFITGGFSRFGNTIEPFQDTAESSAIREACLFACRTENSFAFCCTKHTLGDEEIVCADPRLDVGCVTLSCAAVSCASQ